MNPRLSNCPNCATAQLDSARQKHCTSAPIYPVRDRGTWTVCLSPGDQAPTPPAASVLRGGIHGMPIDHAEHVDSRPIDHLLGWLRHRIPGHWADLLEQPANHEDEETSPTYSGLFFEANHRRRRLSDGCLDRALSAWVVRLSAVWASRRASLCASCVTSARSGGVT